MFISTKSYTIDCGHRLLNNEGKCQQLHGHTYTLIFGLCRTELVDDMVMDFNELTEILNVRVLKLLDHKLLLSEDDPIALMLNIEPELLEGTISIKEVVILPCNNTTSENIARYISTVIDFQFPQIYELLQFVEVSATPTTSARFYPKEEVKYEYIQS